MLLRFSCILLALGTSVFNMRHGTFKSPRACRNEKQSVSYIPNLAINHLLFSYRRVISTFALVICMVILTWVYNQPGPRSKGQLIVAARQYTTGGCFTRTLTWQGQACWGATSPVPVLQAPLRYFFSDTRERSLAP